MSTNYGYGFEDEYLDNYTPKKRINVDRQLRNELLKVIEEIEEEQEEQEEKIKEKYLDNEEEIEEIEEVEEENEVLQKKRISPRRLKVMRINDNIKEKMEEIENNKDRYERVHIESLKRGILRDIKSSLKEDSDFYETWFLNFKYYFYYGGEYEESFGQREDLKIKALVNHRELVIFAGDKYERDFQNIKEIHNLRNKFRRGQIDKKEIGVILENIKILQKWIETNPLINIYNYISSYYQNLGRRINYDLFSKVFKMPSELDVEYQRGYLELSLEENKKYEREVSNMLHTKYMEILKNSRDIDEVKKVEESFKNELKVYRSHLEELLKKGLKIKKRNFGEDDLKQIAKFIPLFFMMGTFILEGSHFTSFTIIAITVAIMFNSLWIVDGVAEIKEKTETQYNLEWSEVLISLSLIGLGIRVFLNPSYKSGLSQPITGLSGILMIIVGIVSSMFWERIEVERVVDEKLVQDYDYKFHGINFLMHGIRARKKKQVEALMKCSFEDIYYDCYFQGARSCGSDFTN